MITCKAAALVSTKITELKPGVLFADAGGRGQYVGVVVDNREGKYVSWMYLTGRPKFLMDDLGRNSQIAHITAFNVLPLTINWFDLRLQIEHTSITRIATEPTVGSLLISDKPRIITKFKGGDDSAPSDTYGVSLEDLERDQMEQFNGYCSDKWRLIALPSGLPSEVIVEFSDLSN